MVVAMMMNEMMFEEHSLFPFLIRAFLCVPQQQLAHARVPSFLPPIFRQRQRQRYSAPQSPINVIIFRPFERSRTASMSARSASDRWNLNTFRLSSGCSETPRRVPLNSNIASPGGGSKRFWRVFEKEKKRREGEKPPHPSVAHMR